MTSPGAPERLADQTWNIKRDHTDDGGEMSVLGPVTDWITVAPVERVEEAEALAAHLAWLLATVRSRSTFSVGHDATVTQWVTVHDGTERGLLIEGYGRTTNEAAHDLKAKLLQHAREALATASHQEEGSDG